MPDRGIVVNTRVLGAPLTGVQRYTAELLGRLDDVEPVSPRQSLDGPAGHAWEQIVLPTRLGGRLLWSPSNTGPLAVERQVVTIHDLAALEHREGLNRRFAAWYGWLLPRLARRVRRIIVPSAFTRDRLLELTRVRPERVAVVPNGVDGRFAPQPPDAVATAATTLALPSRKYVLSLGSLEPRKNLRGLLAAWRDLEPRLPEEVWLVVAGERGKGHVFRDAAVRPGEGRVHFTGRVDDNLLPALYSGALAFVYPALYEGFGLPPLEAMACGAPVVAGDRAALPEVVGDAALLVDPADPGAIGAALARLVEDAALRAQLSQRGRERAAAFTWDRAAEQTRRVLMEAVVD